MSAETISIFLNSDAMTATVTVAPGFRGRLSPEMLIDAAAAAGLAQPLALKIINELLADHNQGLDISGRIVARGTPPTPPRPPIFMLTGNPKFPVFPGDAFARLEPGAPGRPGLNLLGQPVAPGNMASGPAPRALPEKGVTRVGDQFLALRHGLVSLDSDQSPAVKELFYLSLNRLELKGTVFAKDFFGAPVTVNRIRQAFLAMGVTLPPCVLFLERALAVAQDSGRPQDGVLLACALNPRPGHDGHLDMHVRDKRAKAGITDAHGRIDYRQRGRLPTVAKGALIATYVDATPGHPGRILDNTYIPTLPGREQKIRAGANVLLEDDRHSFYAQTDGLLLLQENSLSVSEVYYVNGNVDMHIGHVEMERGSIHVRGSVVAGFRLSCPGSIVVESTVEDARLMAGGDIEIAGGLVMGGKGLVQAGGNVICLFASKARIDVEGDISVVNELINCQVLADGHVTVTGDNSKIIGGTIQAGEGISALEVGTPFGSRTIIHLGLDEGFLHKKNQEASRLRSSLRDLEAKLGPGASADILERFPPEEAEHITKLIHTRNMIAEFLSRLEERIARCEAKIESNMGCVLKVLGAIHPGTVLHCLGKNMTVRSPLEFSQISFDPRRMQFRVTPLQPPAKSGHAALTPGPKTRQ